MRWDPKICPQQSNAKIALSACTFIKYLFTCKIYYNFNTRLDRLQNEIFNIMLQL